ncbi:hypothetical protein R3P38DRAFT_2497696 [Favolaschia claudopus]|uniref:Uncharacterized protein n=1 Tax=Favolaschia claudopus TaxID=2862362 RepID=A0AAW0DZ26_9AGAR
MESSEIYCSVLIANGHGLPLFLPSPPDDLPDQIKDIGIQIGDVGLVCYDGGFDTLFNICRPPEDPANRFGVPPAFVSINLGPNEIEQVSLFHRIGLVISNEKSSRRPSTTDPSKTIAALHLPEGASKSDLRSPESFQNIARQNAVAWFEFVFEKLQRSIKDSPLYLVTGVTKTSSWRITVLDNCSDEVREWEDYPGSLEFRWDNGSFTQFRGPNHPPGEDQRAENQTVFIRGFKISMRPSESAQHVLRSESFQDEESTTEDVNFSCIQ